jgi:hypothetical protein
MLQIVINHSNFVSSCCYLKGFRFKEGAEIGVYGERGRNTKSNNSGKICTRDDNYAQSVARGHCFAWVKA